MRYLLVLCLVVLAAPAMAEASSWQPGTPVLVSAPAATVKLKQKYDHAWCKGIPYYGHRGTFPNDQFNTFRCSIKRGNYVCNEVRYEAVKTTQRGEFRLNRMRKGICP